MHALFNFVAKGSSPDEWVLVLVEEPPWDHPVDGRLSAIQDRLYGCIDAAIDGKLAEKFPETRAKRIIIRLDCYDAPEKQLSEFFSRFSGGDFGIRDYGDALAASEHVESVGFEPCLLQCEITVNGEIEPLRPILSNDRMRIDPPCRSAAPPAGTGKSLGRCGSSRDVKEQFHEQQQS